MAFVLGIPALYINLAVAAWIKFDRSMAAAISTIVVLALSLVAMAFFHRKWTSHILETVISDPVRGEEAVSSAGTVPQSPGGALNCRYADCLD
jgi:hypothetical protein